MNEWRLRIKLAINKLLKLNYVLICNQSILCIVCVCLYITVLCCLPLSIFVYLDVCISVMVLCIFIFPYTPPQHLLSASVMSAPATIAICKLNYPETKKSVTKEIDDVKLTKG